VRKVESIARGNDEVVGNKVRVKVVKNKIAPPFRKAEMDIMFGKGISAVGSMLEAAIQLNLIEKAGSWYSYGKERIGQGVENARTFLESNPAVYTEIEKKVRETFFPKLGTSIASAAATAQKEAAAAEPAASLPPAKPKPAPAAMAEEESDGDGEAADPGKELF
jgi:recombination protein RecA